MATAEDILSIIIENEIKIDLKNLDYVEPLSEQELDSLDITLILFAIEEKFGVKIPEEDINKNKLSSIDNIVSYINGINR